jgi:hypothetical protein
LMKLRRSMSFPPKTTPEYQRDEDTPLRLATPDDGSVKST